MNSCFARNLAAERGRFRKNENRAFHEESLMLRDRQIYPRREHNSHGEPVFDLHPAKLELREDVKAGMHKGLTPADFQAKRINYGYFDKTKFKERIYQEEKLQKYFHYLDSKRKAQQQYRFGWGDGVVYSMVTRKTS
jgi:hypothetical protein